MVHEISDFDNYYYAFFVGKSLRRKNVKIFIDIYLLHYTKTTTIALVLPQTILLIYHIVSTTSKVWNDVFKKSDKDLISCKFTAFKKTIFQTYFSKYKNSNWNNLVLFRNVAIQSGFSKHRSYYITTSVFIYFFYFFLSFSNTFFFQFFSFLFILMFVFFLW